jgi:hypothetical protein
MSRKEINPLCGKVQSVILRGNMRKNMRKNHADSDKED